MKISKLFNIFLTIALVFGFSSPSLIYAGETEGGIQTWSDTGVSGTVKGNPVTSPWAGTYTSTQSVTISATGSSSIRYTTDGADPSCSSGNVYSSALSINSSTNLKTIACYPDNSNSGVLTFTYTISSTSTSSSGGGGGGWWGGGGGWTSFPKITLPTTLNESKEVTIVSKGVQMPTTGDNKGVFTNTIYSTANWVEVKFDVWTKVYIENDSGEDEIFTWRINDPRTTSESVFPKNYAGLPDENNRKFVNGFSMLNDWGGKDVTFDEYITVTLDIWEEFYKSEDLAVYYYNKEANPRVYERVPTSDVTLSEDGTKTIFKTKILGRFIIYETDEKYTPSSSNNNNTNSTETIDNTSENQDLEDLIVFSDLENHWSKPYAEDLISLGIITGKSGNKFDPDGLLTRAEMAKVIATVLGLNIDLKNSNFTDVSSSDWHVWFIMALRREGIIAGYEDGTFKPNNSINRAEFLKILFEGFGEAKPAVSGDPFSDVKKTDWFARYVNRAKLLGLVKGYEDGKFHPERNITRGEMAKIISIYLEMKGI